MLIIEIVLTIFAWRNGWKWMSLIPMGACLLIGFLIGIGIGMAGGSTMGPNPFLSIFDFGAIIALIVMVAKKPKSTNEPKINQ